MMFLFLQACMGALGLYLAILLVKVRLSLRAVRGEPIGEAPFSGDQITIVQPILGGDPCLGDMLRQTLENTPMATRFLWLVDTDDAPGRAAVESLSQTHPERIEILWCDRAPEGINPKAYKLQNALTRLDRPYIAVLDDDTTISQRNLCVAFAALDHADLYTGIPCYQSTDSCWESLVTHFVNNNSIMAYLSLLPLVGPLSINGMFYVMPMETLRALGGFSSIEDRLCDDYAVARLLLANGRRIHQGIVPQYLRTSVFGMRHYVQIMHRWFVFANVLVRDQTLAVRMLLLVMLGLPPLMLWTGMAGTFVLMFRGWFTPASECYALLSAAALGITLVARHALIRFLHRSLFDREAPLHFAVSILSELLQPFHWLHATAIPVIQWRTRRIRARADNTFEILDW